VGNGGIVRVGTKPRRKLAKQRHEPVRIALQLERMRD
jgi:hypothetical protein